MLGNLAKGWKGAVVAAALLIAAGVAVWIRCSPSRPQGPRQMLFVCLSDGSKFLASAIGPGDRPPKCPKCSGESAAALVFECPKGHRFVGYLQKPAPPAGGAAKTEAASPDAAYARHLPLLFRPGVDKDWAPSNLGTGAVCPVCKLGVQRPIVDFSGIGVDAIELGGLPSTGGSK